MPGSKNPKVCGIVPCFNEERNIARVVETVRKHLDVCIVIDDCSTDGTFQAASKAGARVLRHEVNMGKGMALRNGFALAKASGFEGAVTLDGDGQHDPDEIPRFLEAFQDGQTDIVLGNRMRDSKEMPLVRRLTNRFSSWCVTKLSGVTIYDSQVGFRLIRLETWQALGLKGKRFDLESEIIIKACRQGAKLAQVPIKTIYNPDGKSHINPIIDSVRFFRTLWACR